MKIRDIIKTIEADGEIHVKTKGSHRQFEYPIKSGHPGHDVKLDTSKSILTQAGLRGKP